MNRPSSECLPVEPRQPAPAQRLNELEQLVNERSAELTWTNERLVAALYERSAAEARLDDARSRDHATGLMNRRTFEAHIERAVHAQIAQGEPVAVLCIGVDRLSQVRDTLGLAAADTIARVLGERLRLAVRGTDTLARVGDNEFGLLLSRLRHPLDAATVARKLFEVVGAPLLFGGQTLRLTPAVGVAVAPEDATTGELLVTRAVAAMQFAFEHRTDLYQYFRPEIAQRSARRLHLEAELAAALERDEFRILFQPRVRTRDRRVVGAEALLRWKHPERGLLAPDAFLDVAQETGLIVPIGARVLELACRQAAGWPAELSVAVNLAPSEFHGKSVLGLVAGALDEAGLAAPRLQVEISETALAPQAGRIALDVLEHLGQSGVRIVLDNFGAGTASLDALRRMPIDGIKLDGDFVRNAVAAERDREIVTALAALGKRLKLRVIAAGVEDEAQFACVRKAGVTEAQGYLLGRPMQPEQFTAQLAVQARPRSRRA